MENGLEQQVLAKAQKWLDGNYDAETKKQMVHSRCSSCNFSSCSGIGSCAGEKGKEQKRSKDD